jgi:hypothetical protein
MAITPNKQKYYIGFDRALSTFPFVVTQVLRSQVPAWASFRANSSHTRAIRTGCANDRHFLSFSADFRIIRIGKRNGRLARWHDCVFFKFLVDS